MFKSFCSNRGLIAGLLSLTMLLTACDSGSLDSPTEQDAATATVEAMAPEQAEATNEASADAQLAPRRAVVVERLPYAEVDDELVYGHFVFPADMIEPLAAIVVIHEWWGLNDNIRAMAERLAGEGYIVLAVDLFGGKVATSPEGARRLMIPVVENPESASENMRQAYEFVNATAGAPRIASLGWSFGGGWSMNTAIMFPDELDAVVIYYGHVSADEDKLRPVDVPILGLFGAEDQSISVESVRAFEAALERLRKNYEIQIYPGAGHAFANPKGANYNAAAADDAWKRTLRFLGQNLSAGADGS